jgi:hypothetical protein
MFQPTEGAILRQENTKMYTSIGVTWVVQMPPPQYFFNLGIVYLVTELNNGK